jgi:hypothetical protein
VTFEARVYVQGAANCVPHVDRGSLLVLFPKPSLFAQHRAELPPFPGEARGRRGPAGYDDVLEHSPFVHLDRRHLEGDPGGFVPNPEWSELALQDEWVGIETDSEIPMELPPDGIPGTPSIERLLKDTPHAQGDLDATVLPADGDLDPPKDLVTAGLFLDAGTVSPVSEYEAPFTFRPIREIHAPLDRTRGEEIYSGVLKVELGRVSRATLLRRRFGGGKETIERTALHPIGDELNLWVRNVCQRKDGKTPKPGDEVVDRIEAGTVDTDFVLNYLLRADLGAFLKSVSGDLPMPKITTTWLRGGPIGSDLVRCMRLAEKAASFSSAF